MTLPKYNIKCANLLDKYGFKGTFYIDVARMYKAKLIEDVKHISEWNEVGSHTMTHRNLLQIPLEEVTYELYASKQELERLLNKECLSFAYPYGGYNKNIIQEVVKAGYSSARTTTHFNTMLDPDPYRLSVTLSAYPHVYRDIIKAATHFHLPEFLVKPYILKSGGILRNLFLINYL